MPSRRTIYIPKKEISNRISIEKITAGDFIGAENASCGRGWIEKTEYLGSEYCFRVQKNFTAHNCCHFPDTIKTLRDATRHCLESPNYKNVYRFDSLQDLIIWVFNLEEYS